MFLTAEVQFLYPNVSKWSNYHNIFSHTYHFSFLKISVNIL